MLHAVTFTDAHRYGDALPAMFRLRRQRFLTEQNYQSFEYRQMEFDQYDLLATTYLVSLGPMNEVLGCTRLNSTRYPYMLKQLWPEMIDGPPPQSDTVWEASRICVDGELSPEARARVVQEIVLGYLEFGLANDIEKFIGVMYDEIWVKVFGRHGCNYTHWKTAKVFEPGNPQRLAHAGYISVSKATLARVRETTGIHASVLVL